MNKTKGFLLAAAVAAMVFILSCGEVGGGEGGESSPSMGGVSSSSVTAQGGGSSSSDGNVQGISSSSAGVESSSSVDNAGVVIGEQTWFKRNLDVVPNGTNVATNSECYGEDGYIYDAESGNYVVVVLTAEQIQANCNKYGRFYDWVTAMKLPSSCHNDSNDRFCEELIQPKHQGICPDGWHIPSEADWEKLLRYIDDDNGATGVIGGLTFNTYASYITAKHLKSKKGWEEFNRQNGLDTYGFSVLPVKPCFWSTHGKYIRCFEDNNGSRMIGSASGIKVDGKYSVRCIKD